LQKSWQPHEGIVASQGPRPWLSWQQIAIKNEGTALPYCIVDKAGGQVGRTDIRRTSDSASCSSTSGSSSRSRPWNAARRPRRDVDDVDWWQALCSGGQARTDRNSKRPLESRPTWDLSKQGCKIGQGSTERARGPPWSARASIWVLLDEIARPSGLAQRLGRSRHRSQRTAVTRRCAGRTRPRVRAGR